MYNDISNARPLANIKRLRELYIEGNPVDTEILDELNILFIDIR